MQTQEDQGPSPISTGRLPPSDQVQALIDEAYRRFRLDREGAVSQTYPALAEVPPDLFGLCLVSTHGEVFGAGDFEREFVIMSVSKPFVFALMCQQLGARVVRELIGVNGTGLPFNSLAAVEYSPDGRTNPMVNAGAIATTALAPGGSREARWEFLREGLSRFAGRELGLNQGILTCALQSNDRNHGLARLLNSLGRLQGDPTEAVELYTSQCSLDVSARDLAVMGATLADGGVNPLTKRRVLDQEVCHYTLAVMTIAGLYETSGDWLYDVGVPGKSGIGGGLVTSVPGKGGLGSFGPRLDAAGNSVKGGLSARFLSQRLALDLFASKPE
ncbi:MAG: glutaminase A [Myxococcales bacterium]